jgi:hypothetical protein
MGADIGTLALYSRTTLRFPRQTVSKTAGEDRCMYSSIAPEWCTELISRP